MISVRQPRGGDVHVREGDGERVLPGVRRLPPQVQVCLRRLEERKEGNTEKTVIINTLRKIAILKKKA